MHPLPRAPATDGSLAKKIASHVLFRPTIFHFESLTAWQNFWQFVIDFTCFSFLLFKFAACRVVVFHIAVIIMEKEQEIVPNYVIISPHAFQNNKTVEFFAKHISLIFAAIFSACMILSQFNTEHNFWFLFLPQFIYFSIVYIFGRNSTNKTFHLIQNAMALILLPPSLYAIKHFLPHQRILLLITLCLLVIYPIILHIVYKKHFTKDLSTAESVSTLNTIDTSLTVFFLTYVLSFFVVRDLLRILLPQFGTTPSYQNVVVQFLFRYPSVILACFIINGIRGAFMMHFGAKDLNIKKTPAPIEAVEIDCDGRAWFSAYSSIVHDFSKLKKRYLRSSVRPGESVGVPLKQDVVN